ncbi:hypothetical protein Tsubulata_016565 [Turnera subulata]|uniref:BHLH domain-containing protein n=1 Tax=Turnera subulata TaxID=218843 RepID=A0A9Q0FD20_9ROSI|nr:hypothetical protein Tsubulata_016565 [Turnera subulata]
MGIPAHPLAVSLGDMIRGNGGIRQQSNGSSSLLRKFMEAQARRRSQTRRTQEAASWKHGGRVIVRSRRPRRVLMKRRTRLDDSRRVAGGIQRRVKTLKKLIPNSESMGLDGLFRETAEYILSLQMRVKAMQTMVNALAGSDE